MVIHGASPAYLRPAHQTKRLMPTLAATASTKLEPNQLSRRSADALAGPGPVHAHTYDPVLSKLKLRSGARDHLSIPIHFAQKYFSLNAELTPFPSGTGHMITALRAGEIDVGIGQTEGWIAGLGKTTDGSDGGYKLVGTYVENLPWLD